MGPAGPFWTSGRPRPEALAIRNASSRRRLSSCQPAHYLLIILDVLVGHSHEQLPEVLPLAVLPPLHVGFQISIETLHPILTFLHICWYLEGGCIHRSFVCVTGTSCPYAHTFVRGQITALKCHGSFLTPSLR